MDSSCVCTIFFILGISLAYEASSQNVQASATVLQQPTLQIDDVNADLQSPTPRLMKAILTLASANGMIPELLPLIKSSLNSGNKPQNVAQNGQNAVNQNYLCESQGNQQASNQQIQIIQPAQAQNQIQYQQVLSETVPNVFQTQSQIPAFNGQSIQLTSSPNLGTTEYASIISPCKAPNLDVESYTITVPDGSSVVTCNEALQLPLNLQINIPPPVITTSEPTKVPSKPQKESKSCQSSSVSPSMPFAARNPMPPMIIDSGSRSSGYGALLPILFISLFRNGCGGGGGLFGGFGGSNRNCGGSSCGGCNCGGCNCGGCNCGGCNCGCNSCNYGCISPVPVPYPLPFPVNLNSSQNYPYPCPYSAQTQSGSNSNSAQNDEPSNVRISISYNDDEDEYYCYD